MRQLPHFLIRIVFAVMLILSMSQVSWAQLLPEDVLTQQKTNVEELRKQTQVLKEEINSASTSDEALVKIKQKLDGLSKSLLQSGLAFRPRLAEINLRLEQLGAAPAEGQGNEIDIVEQERARLTAEKNEINGVLGYTEETSVMVSQLIEHISSLRRALFAQTLSQKVDINYELFTEVTNAAGYETKSFIYLLKSWWDFILWPDWDMALGVIVVAAIPAGLIHFSARRWFGHSYLRDPTIENPSYLNRLSVAFWSTILPSLAIAVFFTVVYMLFQDFDLLRPDIGELMVALFSLINIWYFVYRLAHGVLSPDMPNWRLLPVAPKSARILIWMLSAAAVTHGVEYFLEVLNSIMSSPLSLTVAKSVLGTGIIGALVFSIAMLKPLEDRKTGALRSWPSLIKLLLILLGLTPIIAALLGYIGFARFVAQQIVVTGAVMVTMYLGFLTARAITNEKAFAETTLGGYLRRRFKASDTLLDQLGLLAGILINLAVLMIGVPLILMQFGFQWAEIEVGFFRLMTGFKVGNFSISVTNILTGIALFVIGYFLTRAFQNWLDGSVMERGRVEPGVRNSIRTVIGYIGMALAGLLGISAAGVNLSSLALIAGGLSLGIGFGLQNVVSNFVSGLILLAERPLKVGDWVQTGTVSGFVKKISVRATEVETFQRESIIIPNSTLINENVGNWTHRNKMGRSDMPVLIAYNDDVRRIHALLLEIVSEQAGILKNPEPAVILQSMSEMHITGIMMRFEVRFFLSDITFALPIRTELQMTIIERFNQEGIPVVPTVSPAVESKLSSEVVVSEQ